MSLQLGLSWGSLKGKKLWTSKSKISITIKHRDNYHLNWDLIGEKRIEIQDSAVSNDRCFDGGESEIKGKVGGGRK